MSSRLKFINLIINKIISNPRSDRMFPIVSSTWNPVSGCPHNCKYCWARRLAETKLKHTHRYKNGFIPKLNYRTFSRRFKRNEIVFTSDMGDLFAEGIPKEWVLRVLRHVERYPKTYFLFLTKNPARYYEFLKYFPENVVLGATIETNRDDLYTECRISRAPLPSKRYMAMRDLEWDLKFISIEPILEFDLDEMVKWVEDIDPVLTFVGYDNWNNKLPEPRYYDTLELIDKLEYITIVIRKTIRRAWYEL